MESKINPLLKLVEQFERMPGIGHKSAQRLAFHVLNMSDAEITEFSEAILNAHKNIHRCSVCCDLTDSELCPVCENDTRDRSVICVVEDPRDVMAIERTREYNGVYHVLHGAISPLNGIGPEDITTKELIARLGNDEVKEVIMATNPTVEGEATAVFLSRLIKPLGIEVSRLAYGVPVGADLEYADEVTLSKAIEGRKRI
ncbi:MAG: recombination mediator RecR [Clostridiales bacterium]|nr:recombination mediator RecR [Clostridiales bacterium]